MEYQGLYSDFIKEKAEPAAEIPKFVEPVEKEAPKKQQPKKKLTFNEQREYDGILDKIAELEAKIESCEQEMAKAGADFEKLNQLTAEVDELTSQYDEKIERWTYLQEIAES